MSTVKKNEARKRGREWWIPILAGDFREDLSEEVAYKQRHEWGEKTGIPSNRN